MTWGSLENFLAMGGYAFYVWGSYLVTLGLVFGEMVLLLLRKRHALEHLRSRTYTGQGDR